MDSKMVPTTLPRKSRAELIYLLSKRIPSLKIGDNFFGLVGVRGFFSTTFSPPGNNIRVYDDAIFLITPTACVSWNANTDPSVSRSGVAVLKTGVWEYKAGIHGLSKPKDKQYMAFVQAAPVTVHRENQGDDTGYFGINIHKGGYGTTSSLGCQTIYPDQWTAMRTLVYSEMKRHGATTIPYVLVDA